MKHLVIFRLSALGDVAMTVPIIRTLVDKNPNLKITVVSKPFCKPLFENIERVSFFSADTKNQYKGFAGIFKLFKALYQLKPDVFIDFHDVLRSKIIRTLFRLNRIPVFITQKGRKEKKELTRVKNKIFKPLKSVYTRHCEALEKAGFPINLADDIFPEKQNLPKNFLEKDKKWIGIAPFAQHQTKVYSLEKIKEVALELAQDSQILLFGSKAEYATLETIKKLHPNIVNIAGSYTFAEELHIIQHLDVMISMDSANGHLAAIYGIPVITLWGNTHPYAGFVPYKQPEENQITVDRTLFPLIPTSIYGNKVITGYARVIDQLKTSTIIQRVRRILS